jgi:hypothetical protein
MKLLKYPALLGLALTIVPPLLYMVGTPESLSLDTVKKIMVGGMLLWYAAATPWIAFRKDELGAATQVQI